MPLAPGARLGAFEIVAAIGAGGMGEVYRARDTKLQREVALKVLSGAVSADPDRLERFEREAVALAALNHPHIAQLYGTVESESGTALVMELVDGEDLAAVIARGALPIDEAIAIARHVADALDAAHSAGIIHRDLKPANVKQRADGVVKVLDFGLAKLAATSAPHVPGATSAETLAHSPTMTRPAGLTTGGMILGTAAYMSPEQARGRPVDKRADIWAFGCLFYELLTGRQAFGGETVTDVLGSIVKSDPEWSLLPAATPPAVARLLRRCLQKDPAKRLRDIGDAIVELDGAATEAPAAPTARSGGHRWRLASAWLASLIAVAAAAAALGYRAQSNAPAPLQKFTLATQEDGGSIREPVISPDGRHIAYVGRSRISVQSLNEWKPRELVGTEAAVRPFWSPAGDWIAYFRSETLLKVPASGGPVVKIADLPAVQSPLGSASGVWGEDGTITISIAGGLPPLRVVATGGDVVPMEGVLTKEIVDLHWLRALPDGRLLTVVHRENGLNEVAVIANGQLRTVLQASDVSSPAYAPSGHILYSRQSPTSGLWAVPFSVDRLEVTGEPFPIGEGIEPTVATDGTLSFLGEPDTMLRQLSWFTMDGRVGALLAEPREWSEGLAISKDGRRVLAAAADGIWAFDTATGSRSRVTSGRTDLSPTWVGASAIAFVRTDANDPVIVLKQLADGSERILARRARFPHATDDLRRIGFNIDDGTRTPWQIGWIDLDRGSEIHRLGAPHLGARFPSISPDGRLVAYVSGEVGRDEVFLTTLPRGDGKWQISTDGGNWTLIAPRGDAVVYRAPDGAFMSVPIAMAGADVTIGQPQKLFDWGAGWKLDYALAADGLRGVAAMPAAKSARVPKISVVQHWEREFEARQR